MAQKIDGGTIQARLVLDSKKYQAGLKKMSALAVKFAVKTRVMIKGLGQGMDFWGGRMVESAERFTFLAGAIMAPIILSMKNFADQNAKAREKVMALSEQLRKVPPLNFAARAHLVQQLISMQKIEQETRKAAATQARLTKAFKDLAFQIGKLMWEVLGPIVPKIIANIKSWIVWIQANKELAGRVIKVAASFGALMLTLAPLFAIGGKIIRVLGAWVRLFSLLFSPLGLIVLAFGALYLLIKKQLDPILKVLWENTKEIFEKWMKGDLTLKEAMGKIGMALKDGWNALSRELGGWPNIILETVTNTVNDIIIQIKRLIEFISSASKKWTEFTKTEGFKTVGGVVAKVSTLAIDQPAANLQKALLPQFQILSNLFSRGSIFPAGQVGAGGGGNVVQNITVNGLGVTDFQRDLAIFVEAQQRKMVTF